MDQSPFEHYEFDVTIFYIFQQIDTNCYSHLVVVKNPSV